MDAQLNLDSWYKIIRDKQVLLRNTIRLEVFLVRNFDPKYYGFVIRYEEDILYFSGYCFNNKSEASTELDDYLKFLQTMLLESNLESAFLK